MRLPACLALLLCGCGAPCELPHPPSPETPAPPAAPPAPGSLPPPSPAAPSALPVLPDPGGGGPLRPSWQDITAGSVPQVPNRFQLFHGAAPVEAARFDDGLLLCDVRVSREANLDTFKGPDLSLHLRVGPNPPRNVRGAEDTWGDTLSFPVRTLGQGDSIWLRVVDRDVWHDEYAGSDTQVFRGRLPLVFRGEHFVVECRGLPSAQVEMRVGERLARAGQAFARLERAPGPTVSRDDLGYPGFDRMAAVGAAADVAAWVDWDDPRVAALGARLGAFEARWQQSARAEIARAVASLPAGDWLPFGAGLEARIADVPCGVAASRLRSRLGAIPYEAGGARCFARVELRRVHGGPEDLAPAGVRPHPLDLRILDAGGTTRPSPPIAYERDGLPLPPREPVTLDGSAAVVLLIPLADDPATDGDTAPRLLVRRAGRHLFLAPLP